MVGSPTPMPVTPAPPVGPGGKTGGEGEFATPGGDAQEGPPGPPMLSPPRGLRRCVAPKALLGREVCVCRVGVCVSC